MYRSLAVGRRVQLDHVGIFADGVAVREVGERTFPIVQQTVDEIVRVTNDEICASDQGRLRRHAVGDGARRRAGRCRPEDLGRTRGRAQPVARRRAERREHQLRSSPLRRRASRSRRGARDAARGDDSRAEGRLSRVLRGDRPPHRHRVQLPAREPRSGPHLRRLRHGIASGRRPARRAAQGRRLRDRRSHGQRDGQAARPPHGGRARCPACAASGSAGSSFRNAPVR